MFLTFSSLYIFVGFKVQKTLNKNSKLIADGYNAEVKNIQEGIGSIRDIIIDRSHSLYESYYTRTNHIKRVKLFFVEYLRYHFLHL